MDGKWLASRILQDLRRDKELSQRALAQLADVPQPTIAEIETGRREPSLTLLSKLAEATGKTLEVCTVPLERHSAVGTAHRVAELLGPKPTQTSKLSRREDAALRAVLDLRNALRHAKSDDFDRLIALPPTLTRATRWDAFLAAVVEDECERRDVSPPRWTSDVRRHAEPPWYLSENPELHDWELATAPAAFVRHGVLAVAEELESV